MTQPHPALSNLPAPSLKYVSQEEFDALLVSRRSLTRVEDQRRGVHALCDWDEGVLYFVEHESAAS